MKLMTKEIEKILPKFYSNEGKSKDEQMVAVKFFDCWGSGRWYALEGQQLPNGDWEFFGYVTGLVEDEFGYFTLNQLKEALGWRLERDMHFDNGKIPISKIISGEKY